jgi:HAAS domain-containing protein
MSVAGGSGPLPGGAMDARVDDYLARVRKGLAGLSREAASEIVEELRSHILEKAALNGDATPAAVEDVLAALGKPEELPAQYMADDLLERAARSRSPRLFLRGLVLWASLSAGGIFVLVGCVVGYFLGGAFLLCAILKPLHPQSAGLWQLPDEAHSYSLRLGFGSVPAGGTELLGWWMVPVGLLLGGGLCSLTTKFALWCARLYRRSHALNRG